MKTFKSVFYMMRAFVFNVLKRNVMKDVICLRHYKVIRCSRYIKTSQLISISNQLGVFYMIGTLFFRLNKDIVGKSLFNFIATLILLDFLAFQVIIVVLNLV